MTCALSDTEVAELYNNGNGLTYPFITGWSKKIINLTNVNKINGIITSNIKKVNEVL